jgi:hypothetical protein
MYIVKNTVEDKIIGKFETDAEFVHFMRTVAVENEDFDLSILCVNEAKEYLDIYCSNLELFSQDDVTYTVSLTFTNISGKNALQAVKTITKWIEEGVNDMVFDVTNELTDEKFTVDLSEKEFPVLPNN